MSFLGKRTSVVVVVAVLASVVEAQTIWYVNDDGDPTNGCTSWADACSDLQTALGLATAGDQIWVAAGTYTPDAGTGDRTATFQLITGVAVYGGFDGTEVVLDGRAGLFDQTLLSGDLLGNDVPVSCTQDFPDCSSFGHLCHDGFCIIRDNNDENSYHVVTGSGTDASAVIDGFTITAGNADGEVQAAKGAGMFNFPGGSPTITNCTFLRNSADHVGGAMHNQASSHATVTNCTFRDNQANFGGAMSNNASDPTVTNCAFSGNWALSGGGLAGWFSNATVTNCTFKGNHVESDGGGMFNNLESSTTVTNCAFSGNSAYQGGGMYSFRNTSTTVTNCTFSANDAQNGKALAFDSYDQQYPSDFSMTNSILWDGGDEIWNNDGSTITIAYSDVQGGWPGEGNINNDPLCADVAGGDLRLMPGSPCIDAADNSAVPPDAADLDGDGEIEEPIPLDLDGNPRLVDDPSTPDCSQAPGQCGTPPVIDMGAHEAQAAVHCPADFNGDGEVAPADLAALLGAWGPHPGHVLDLNGDGAVGPADLAALLGAWGPCE